MTARALARQLLLLATLLSLALAPNLGYAQTPTSDDSGREDHELKGLVESRPATGRIGEWKVAGTIFLVDANTVFFGFGDSRPSVGRCVEVSLTTATPPVATEIKPDDDCGGNDDNGEDREWRGKVTAAPASGFIGSWTIGGMTFVANEGTFFEGFGGTPPAINDCVEVKYILAGATKVAIRMQPEDDCGAPGVPGEFHFYRGRVDARPDGTRFGAWVIGGKSFEARDGTTVFGPVFGADATKPAVGDCIGVHYREVANARTLIGVRAAICEGRDGVGEFEAHGWLNQKGDGAYLIGPEKGNTTTSISYTVTLTTELKERFGPLLDNPPTCVKVHYRLGANNTRLAREIESRPDFRCEPSSDEHELYGIVKELPASPYIGKWVIGTIEVQVTRETVLEEGPFVVGRLVKVEFVRTGDGTLVALKIEGKGEGRERSRGKAYGKIEALGAVPGNWTIGGQVYAVTADTRLRSGGTDFAVNDCVEVYFQVDAAGKRTAIKIEREESECRVGERGRVFGTVEVMPTGTYTGTWTISGESYTVNARTEFEFEAGVGAPTVGSFVRVTYVIESGVRIARQIKTLVPPGMGDDSYIGPLGMPSGVTALAANTTWSVGGVSFTVTDATLVQDGAADVADGALVKVNAYRDPQGNLVATQVTAVEAHYMPLVRR